MRVLTIAGARPNFMKVSALIREMKKRKGIRNYLVHTGQHHDYSMSRLFFEELGIPKPDINLGIHGGSNLSQIAGMIAGLEKVALRQKPDLIIVVGDVNSTLAGALVASKLGIRLAHVEAGMRYHSWKESEEANRILTDHLSDYLFATDKYAVANLKKEGISDGRIFMVGNTMADALLQNLTAAKKSGTLRKLGLGRGKYAVLTMHRPTNVENRKRFGEMLSAFREIAKELKIVFPVHPRTEKSLKRMGLWESLKAVENMVISRPLGYLEFLDLMANSKMVLTDSGSIQGETTVLGKPCLLLEETCDVPITLKEGSNAIAGVKKETILKAAGKALKGNGKRGKAPKYWDGKAGKRIMDILVKEGGKK